MDRKERIFELRRIGLTYREIGAMCGCSGQYAWSIAKGTERERPTRRVTEEECCYPNLREWMNDNKVSIGSLCRALYGRGDSGYPNQLRWKMNNGTLKKWEIDAILSMTGMSYKEAFANG